MIIIKKVPVDELIDVLTELYEKGIDYVDILSTPGEDNKLSLVFHEDYLSEEMKEEIEETPAPLVIKGKLSDEDLNQLI
jgi:prephenate dehydratase